MQINLNGLTRIEEHVRRSIKTNGFPMDDGRLGLIWKRRLFTGSTPSTIVKKVIAYEKELLFGK